VPAHELRHDDAALHVPIVAKQPGVGRDEAARSRSRRRPEISAASFEVTLLRRRPPTCVPSPVSAGVCETNGAHVPRSIQPASEEDGASWPRLRSGPPHSAEDLRAIKRALLHAPLGPRAAEALASAAIELEERLAREARTRASQAQATRAVDGATVLGAGGRSSQA
jgi:hypothetical protein